MKKIIVFGATGTIGQQLIAQALEVGYEVKAFTRNKNKINIMHERLVVEEGDIFDLPTVEKAIKNRDIVFCTLGGGRKDTVRSAGTLNIIKAMQNTKVQRLICQTTLGAGDSEPTLNFFWRHIMFGWFLKDAFNDHQLQEKYVFESNLDWTIVRPGAFTNGAKTGTYKHGFPPHEKSLQLKISRADVAQFMLQQIQNTKYLFKTPGLSY